MQPCGLHDVAPRLFFDREPFRATPLQEGLGVSSAPETLETHVCRSQAEDTRRLAELGRELAFWMFWPIPTLYSARTRSWISRARASGSFGLDVEESLVPCSIGCRTLMVRCPR